VAGEEIHFPGGDIMKQLSAKQIGVILAIILGVILAFSPIDKQAQHKIDTKKVAKEIISRNDHITAEQLGHLIIDKDPDYQIIDLRSPEEFDKFHIEGTINLPLETLFFDQNLEQINTEKLVILYTNGGTHAAQAWVLLQQESFTNTVVLLGGLNYWVYVYSNPNPPEGVYADSEIFDYQFKVSAGKRFMGNMEAEDKTSETVKAAKIPLRPRKKKSKSADEGC
jgi:rhodanese-related sulfurtransferase